MHAPREACTARSRRLTARPRQSVDRAAERRAGAGPTMPAPTCPTPGSRPAMPVLTTGSRPVRTTSVTSMPVGRAAEAERRNLVQRVLGQRDLVHPLRVFDGVATPGRRRTARWRARPPSQSRRDRRVSMMVESPRSGLASFASEARQVQAFGDVGRAGEPGVAGSGGLDAELGAVAGHRDDHRRAGDVTRGVRRGLAPPHRQVEHEVVVAVDEAQRGGELGPSGARPRSGRRRSRG